MNSRTDKWSENVRLLKSGFSRQFSFGFRESFEFIRCGPLKDLDSDTIRRR